MRINRYIAQSTGMSRRAADRLIYTGQVTVNGLTASAGQDVSDADKISIDGKQIASSSDQKFITIVMNKPVGYVCSRDGQGSKTVYDLLPEELHILKPVGRLDKDSSGLLVMTNNGKLAHELSHPSYQKRKVYNISLSHSLTPLHHQMICDYGIMLEDGVSKFSLDRISEGNDKDWRVTMTEGRNRQIRRTFSALDYSVKRLHRIKFGEYTLANLRNTVYTIVS